MFNQIKKVLSKTVIKATDGLDDTVVQKESIGVTKREEPIIDGCYTSSFDPNNSLDESTEEANDISSSEQLLMQMEDGMKDLEENQPSEPTYDNWLQDKIDALKEAFKEYGKVTIHIQGVDYIGSNGVARINFSYEGIDPYNFDKKVVDKKGQLNYNISIYREDFMNIQFKQKMRNNASCMFEKYTGDEL